MDLGLGIYRVVSNIDPGTVEHIRKLEHSPRYKELRITGLIETPRESFVNTILPFSVEISDALAGTTKGFAVLGPSGDIVARTESLVEAEEIVAGAKITLVTKVDKAPARVVSPA